MNPIVRVAGLPVDVLDGMRCPETAARIAEILAEDGVLDAESGALSSLLHAVIAGVAGPLRPGLVGLRRAVHAGRPPQRREWGPEVAAALPPDVADRVCRWAERVARRRALVAGLPVVLGKEAASAADAVRDAAADVGFRRALSRSSPALDEALERWTMSGRAPARVVARLARYLARAATKTSPYSTFTVSGLAAWVAQGPLAGPPGVLEPRTVLELDALLLAALQPPATVLRRSPGLVEDGGQLVVLGPSPGEPVVTVGLTPAVRACLALLAEPRPRVDVLAALGGDDAGPFVDRLVRLGVLEACRAEAEVPPELDRALRREVPNLAAHRARHAEVAKRAADLAETAGLAGAARLARAHPGAVAHEHALVAGGVLECGRAAWAPVLADLAALRPWFAVHDPTLPARLVLGDWLAARFGPGARLPFLLLHKAIRQEVQTSPDGEPARWLDVAGAVPAELLAASTNPRLRALAELRARPGPRPCWVPDPGRLACYVQPVGDGVVLNGVSTGYGRGWSRLRHLLELDPAPVPEHRCDPEPVELGGLFGTALNRRTPATRLEIEYPGAVSNRPPGERVPLGSLVAAHDPRTGLITLVVPGHGPVRVVHLGMMVDHLLPPAARLAVRLCGFTVLPPAVVPEVEPGAVLATPRVVSGSITVRRARWLVGAGGMPGREPGESDAGYLLRLARWRHRHGIPSRAFLRAGAPGSATGAAFTKSRKPIYVDWTAWPLVDTAERLLRDAQGPVVIEEALPDPGVAPAGHRTVELLVEIPGCGCAR